MAININSNGDNNMGQPIARRTGSLFFNKFSSKVPSDASDSAKTSQGQTNGGATSTGTGGIPASLKVKARGTHDIQGVEHDVNLF